MFRRLLLWPFAPLAAIGAAVIAMGGCAGSATPEGEAQGHSAQRELSDSDQTAFDFFLGKGLTPEQAAGIVGNLDQESGMDPTISQFGGGPGRGIAQWSAGGRWDSGDINCTDFAAQQGEDVDSLQLQLEFIWFELTQEPSFGLDDLQAASTVEDAVTVFQNKYEICGKCAAGNRLDFAQSAFDAFGSDTPPSDDPGPSQTGPGTDDPGAPTTTPGKPWWQRF